MHPRTIDYKLIDHTDKCLVKAITGNLHFDAPPKFGKREDQEGVEDEEEVEDEDETFPESLAEQGIKLEEDIELVDEILQKYDHLPADQKERLKKLT